MIVTGSGGYQGVGFAMPINTAAKIYNQLIKSGKVTRGAIGVTFAPGEVKPELLAVYGAKEGVFVQDVTPGMPAQKAGIRKEDVIVAVDGKPIKDGSELVNRVSDTPVGSEVKITVLRDKKKLDFMVKIGDRRDVITSSNLGGERHETPSEPEKAEVPTPAKFGITLLTLTAARKDAMGFKEKGGVLIEEVTPSSFAEDVGLAKDDVLVSINRQTVESADDVKRIQNTLKPGDPVVFQVMRSDVPAAARRNGQTSRTPKWSGAFLAGTMPNTQ